MAEEQKTGTGKLAIILVRGLVNLPRPVKDTLMMLRLKRKNHCVIVDNNPINIGMLKKVKDYVTWGKISDEVFKEMVEKRGEEFKGREKDRKGKYNYRVLEIAGKKYKPYFRLNPPRKGFGRKGIKNPFKMGGGLGNREDKINDLITRML
ncbi:MAG: uL30 family ribosomal protein [Nanoarchaeota archaeon]|nr:uL30 family ribosomal protein [Nanoarchaeota archaeon]MBU1622652.1 uL30 family ribosomal protein [Nanoarchaeota archaeon]MBU1974233.1 uL30 family ribosomal protein [Nanoarchaeota archaeon]